MIYQNKIKTGGKKYMPTDAIPPHWDSF